MSSAAAARASRKTRRGSVTLTSATSTKPAPAQATRSVDKNDNAKTIQQLTDDLEELTDTNCRLMDKVTQLEERAQYLEASARLDASKLAAEIMDLKEKARKLEIDISSVIDERDALEQEIDQLRTHASDAEVLDEARQMSAQLKDAWIRISKMKTSQQEYVEKLFKAEDTNVRLKSDVSKSIDLLDITKRAQVDETRRWDIEKQEFAAEISSLKEKFAQSSKGGGKQMLDWEQDKARLRNSLKQERAVWDKEKKGFLDQIASLKVKTTALSVQKTAPPEWILEKHELAEQCATLQRRVDALEMDRAKGVDQNGSHVKKLETEKHKLEKKVETLKAKLVEVMEHAITAQSKADGKKAKPTIVQKRRSTVRKGSRAAAKGSASEDDEESGQGTENNSDEDGQGPNIVVEATAPSRKMRAKRKAAVRSINYNLGSSSYDDSEDEDLGGSDTDGDGDEVTEEKDMDVAEDDDDMDDEMQEFDKTQDSSAVQRHDEAEGARSPSPSRSRRASVGKARKAEEESSDSEFEPPKKKTAVATKSRGRGSQRQAATASTDPSGKRMKATVGTVLSSAKRSTGTEIVPLLEADKTSLPSAVIQAPLASLGLSPSPSTSTSAIVSTPGVSVGDGEIPKPTDKIKKKRKLLTGKGLDELGDILNGPGSSLSSTPSTGLVFGKGKVRLKSGGSSLISGSAPNPAKLEALNAIKMAFALPKVRNTSPARDMES